MKKITMVQYGCGKMSKYTVRYALEKGLKIVGAFDIDNSLVGKDLSVVLDSDTPLKVKIKHADEFDAFLQSHEVDIVVVTTTSIFAENYPIY